MAAAAVVAAVGPARLPASAGSRFGRGIRVVLTLLLLLPVALQRASAEATYPPVLPGTQLEFPRDEGSHPDYRIEWWYVTGQVAGANDKAAAPRGFQVTFFRVRTGLAERNPSAFAPRQVLFAHAAIADVESGRLHHAQRAGRTGFDLVQAREGQVDVQLDDWSLRQVRPGEYLTVVHGEDFDFELSLRSTQPPLLQGDRGFSRKGPDPLAASHYYSLPQLQVSGEIVLDGKRQRVTGKAWFDHEWSSNYVDRDALGWDWMGVNLHDGGALMAFRMRDAQGGERWAAATHRGNRDGTRFGNGDGTRLSAADNNRVPSPFPNRVPSPFPQRTFSRDEVEWTPLRSWRSPRTGVTYPVAWRVQVGDRRYLVEPMLLDAELDSRPTTGILYWEGPIRLLDDASGEEVGRGYLELTGYGGKLDL